MSTENKYKVIVDSREQQPYLFGVTDTCAGYVVNKLDTGDYSLEGLEETFTVDRKRNVAEWAANVVSKRFERELVRLDEYQFPFLLLEFSMDDLLTFPHNSGIPKRIWGKLRMSADFLFKRTVEIHEQYKVELIFAHDRVTAQKILISLFERMHNDINN